LQVWNLVGNQAYGERYAAVYPLLQQQITMFEAKMINETDKVGCCVAAYLHLRRCFFRRNDDALL
jgi:hypothetical protein